MSDPTNIDPAAFEIGFVLAGAVSAGCYSAGVMDFVVEALDDYHAERGKPGWDGPTHDVRVPVLAGASAGGMTAGMVGLHLFRALDPVWPGRPAPAPAANRLYASWVTDISIERLLATTDLDDRARGLRSALCSDALDAILDGVFDIAGPTVERPWLGRAGDPTLRVIMTLTNLRGVPYSFPLIGTAGGTSFGMLNHADVVSFRLGAGAPPSGEAWLDVTRGGDAAWSTFRAAALATGAFPVGLAARAITRPAADLWAGGTVGSTDPSTGRFAVLDPDPSFPKAGDFSYWAVDGGTMNNEPLEQARRFLTGGAAEQPDGRRADRAVVLVAPFPPEIGRGPDPVTGTLATVLPRLATALVEQARFKPEELARAHDATNFARFLISPERQLADGTVPRHAMASGALGGFSGFLDESFRRHDYLLGRRNAQAFLRWNFALPKGHALFAGRPIADSWTVRDADRETGTVPAGAAGLDRKRFAPTLGAPATEEAFPIIPLSGRMQRPIEIPAADVPRPSRGILEALRPLIHARAEGVVERLVDVDFLAATQHLGLAAPAIRLGARLYGTEVATASAVERIGAALDDLAASFP